MSTGEPTPTLEERKKCVIELCGTIKHIFPQDTVFDCKTHNLQWGCTVFWTLSDDPERPNKPSKAIKLIFAYEDICDYLHTSESKKENIRQQLIRDIETKFKQFDPENNNPEYTGPTIEEWPVKFQF